MMSVRFLKNLESLIERKPQLLRSSTGCNKSSGPLDQNKQNQNHNSQNKEHGPTANAFKQDPANKPAHCCTEAKTHCAKESLRSGLQPGRRVFICIGNSRTP